MLIMDFDLCLCTVHLNNYIAFHIYDDTREYYRREAKKTTPLCIVRMKYDLIEAQAVKRK